MNINIFYKRLCHSPIIAGILLIALIVSSLLWYSRRHSIAEFCEAAKKGDLAKVQSMLKQHSYFVHSKGNSGFTALHLAAQFGRKEVMELLLAHGAEVNTRSDSDTTPRIGISSCLFQS
jgi:ankyrin repeat protein